MTNERHEKALEAAFDVFDADSHQPDDATISKAIAAYLQAMDAVIVPKVASLEMEHAARERVKPFHDLNEREWRSMMPADFFRLAWPAMLSKAPSHFTTGE